MPRTLLSNSERPYADSPSDVKPTHAGALGVHASTCVNRDPCRDCVLREMEDLTDRDAADVVRVRLDWKYALGAMDQWR